MKWCEYQEAAASFFRRIGFSAEVDAPLTGARGKHKIDVLVSGRTRGVVFRWIVECKHWKSNVPKEKVMALMSIVQDVGADRGFLLSEKGFQSGAIRASRYTNITLLSLEDLKLEAQGTLVKDEAAHLLARRREIHNRLWRLHKATDVYYSHFVRPLGKMFMLDMAIDDGLAGKFPNVYATDDNGNRLYAADWDDLVLKATELLNETERYAEEHETGDAT
jgi:hypothetical protein